LGQGSELVLVLAEAVVLPEEEPAVLADEEELSYCQKQTKPKKY